MQKAANLNKASDWGREAAIAFKAKRLALPEVKEMLVNSCRLIYKVQQNKLFSLSLIQQQRGLRKLKLSQNLK